MIGQRCEVNIKDISKTIGLCTYPVIDNVLLSTDS